MADAPRTLSLPFRVDPTGSIAYTESPTDQLTQRVYGVLSTQPGERIMRPTYGCDLRQFDFASYDPFLEAQMSQVMSAALQAWEPGAMVDAVTVSEPDENGVMHVEALYRTATGTPAAVQLSVQGDSP